MNARELLESAAKAAGVKGDCYEIHGNLLIAEKEPEVGFSTYYPSPPWRPLTDDRDALRLAVRLGILLRTDFIKVLSEMMGGGMDHGEATRCSIVLIAAKIGELKGQQD